MPKVSNRGKELTRRSFLAASTLSLGGLAAAGGLSSLDERAFAQANGKSQEEGVFRGVCRPNCFGFCHIDVHVRDGKIVQTTRGDYERQEYSRICLRGLSHVQRVYDPQRVLYPMRRAEGTARGADQWERISWDEAISEIADKIKYCQSTYGPQSVCINTGSQNSLASMYPWLRFYQSQGATFVAASYDQASCYAMARCTHTGAYWWEANERTDLVNAKTIVAWGANVTDAQIQQWHFIKEAIQQGVKLVVIDPTFTKLASKADLWIPIRPGSDTALLMGIMGEIFKREALNEEYLKLHTVAPFLVREDNGKFLRGSDIGIPEIDTGKVNPYTGAPEMLDEAVVLQGNTLKVAREASDPQLMAEYDFNGIRCRTSLLLLKQEVDKLDLESVSNLTEIPVEDILNLVDICLDQPVTHYVGYGPQAYVNGAHTLHAGLTMCSLIGNLGYPGASWGSFWMATPNTNGMWIVEAGMSSAPTIGIQEFPRVTEEQSWNGNSFPVKMLICSCGNTATCTTDMNSWRHKVIDNMEYIVSVDSAMTDTSQYADIVLPLAQWFEVEDVTAVGETGCMNYNEKAIDPVGESKTDVQIIRLIGEALGCGELYPTTEEEALRGQLDGMPIDYDTIKAKKEVRYLGGETYIPFRDGVFETPSGRMEFYVEDPTPRTATQANITEELIEREHLPRWFPPDEAWPENELFQKYPFVCMSRRPRFRVHSQWFSTKALRELDPEPTAEINPIDAHAKEIKNGDYVECFNDRGHVVAKAVVSEAVRPGTVVYPKGWQSSQFVSGNWSELTNNNFDPFAVSGAFMDCLCDVRKWDGGTK